MCHKLTLIAFAVTLIVIVPSFGSTVYVSADNDNLYTINPTTGATTLIGNMGVEMSDIGLAFVNGAMFGVSFPSSGNSSLYSINPNTGAATKIGTDTGAFLNSLVVAPNGTLYAAGGSAGCGPPPQPACNSLFTINTATGVANSVGTGAYSSSGDLEFVGNTLFLTSLTSTTDQLYSVDPATGAGTLIGDTKFAFVFGLAYVPETGTLYGFNDVGNNVISINTLTGLGTFVAKYSGNFEITGAAVSAVPEPRAAGLAVGLAALAGLLLRRSSVAKRVA